MLPMCQSTTMRVYGAWIKIYCVLCSKTYNTLHSCHNFPAGSRQAARGVRICETSLLMAIWCTTERVHEMRGHRSWCHCRFILPHYPIATSNHTRYVLWSFRYLYVPQWRPKAKNIERHTAHTIVSWPNPKQCIVVRTFDFMMMIIRKIVCYLNHHKRNV